MLCSEDEQKQYALVPVREITDMRNGGVQSGGLSTSRDLVAINKQNLFPSHCNTCSGASRENSEVQLLTE